ncbi:restriction endonuclease subunit S [Helicobacter pylori]
MSDNKIYKLKNIGKIVTGKTPKTSNLDFFNGKYMFITPNDLHGTYRIIKTPRTLSDSGLKSIQNNTIDNTSILVGCIGDVGMVRMCFDKCATNQQINSITDIKDFCNPYYLYYYLSNKKELFKNIALSTVVPIIPKTIFQEIEVLLPNIETQQKIARTLSILDQKIENNHKINEFLHTLAYKIYEYYFKYKPKNAKLEQIIIENPKSSIMVKNAQKTQDKYPFFTSGDNILSYPKAIIDGRNCFLNTGGNASIKFYVGKASYSTDTWCICANEFSDYLYLLLSSIKTHINQSFFQGTSLKHLQKNLLKKYPIYMPSAHEIKKFNQIIMPLLTLISINTRTSKKLEQIRDFLLPLLLKQQVKPQ